LKLNYSRQQPSEKKRSDEQPKRIALLSKSYRTKKKHFRKPLTKPQHRKKTPFSCKRQRSSKPCKKSKTRSSLLRLLFAKSSDLKKKRKRLAKNKLNKPSRL